MSHQTQDFRALIHERGFRITPQREFVLEAIREGQGHTTIDEVCERVQTKSPSVNRATVYRTLEFLRELRLVVAADIGGHTVYEIAGKEPHHHLVCLKCGRQEPLEHRLVKPLFDQIEREHQFVVETNHLALFGLCRVCQQASHSEN